MAGGKRELSFRGCRTRAEAERRLRSWVEQIVEDSSREFQSDVLSDNSQIQGIDVDSLDATVEQNAELTKQAIEDLVAQFHRILDREFGPNS